jgi:hypothetical protein
MQFVLNTNSAICVSLVSLATMLPELALTTTTLWIVLSINLRSILVMMVFAILLLVSVKPEFLIVVHWEACVSTLTANLTNVSNMLAILPLEIASYKQILLAANWTTVLTKHVTLLQVAFLYLLMPLCVTPLTHVKHLF